MPLTNYAIANPNGGAWTVQNTNNASVGRVHDLSLLMEGSSTNLQKPRAGVLTAFTPATTTVPNAFQLAVTGSGLNISVTAGAAIVDRTTPVGPYDVVSTAAGTVTLGTADATNPRIDRIDLQVLDGALGDNSGVSLIRVLVTPGLAAGVPLLPAAPANSIPLGQVLLPAGTVTLTGGMLTDTRKGTAPRGGTRILLPGDLLTDPGIGTPEFRMRYHATYGWLEDYWDSVGSAWRGTQVLEIAQPAFSLAAIANGATGTVASQVIADPGWPYHIESAVGVAWQQTSAAAAGACGLEVHSQMDSATFGTNIVSAGYAGCYSTSNSVVMFSPGVYRSSKTLTPAGYTGAHTLYFVAQAAGGGVQPVSSGTNQFAIKLVPA